MNRNTERYSVSLREEFDAAACLDARERIAKIAGVAATFSFPQGCFGIDPHRVWVDIEAGSAAVDELRRLPEVKTVKKGPQFD